MELLYACPIFRLYLDDDDVISMMLCTSKGTEWLYFDNITQVLKFIDDVYYELITDMKGCIHI